MNILLVEDDDPKRQQILSFLKNNLSISGVQTARSVRSAVEAVLNKPFDLILLDMSLDTYDRGQNESGGKPQGFGGAEVLRYMKIYQVVTPVVIITGYEAFSRDGKAINHDNLSSELKHEFPDIFKGLVYYNSITQDWTAKLERLIQNLRGLV